MGSTKVARLNRFGQVTQVFDLGQYELHHDINWGPEGTILALEGMIAFANNYADEAERLADEGQFGKGSMEPKVRERQGWMTSLPSSTV